MCNAATGLPGPADLLNFPWNRIILRLYTAVGGRRTAFGERFPAHRQPSASTELQTVADQGSRFFAGVFHVSRLRTRPSSWRRSDIHSEGTDARLPELAQSYTRWAAWIQASRPAAIPRST
jgi:hypothetical protein